MEWLIENWLIVALIGGMGAMHLFGHRHHAHGASKNAADGDTAPSGGCCGGHDKPKAETPASTGGCCGGKDKKAPAPETTGAPK